MSELICRKTMMRCNHPGMCSPHGGCQPDKTEWQSGYDEGRRLGVKTALDERDQLRAELAGLRTGFDAQNEVIAGLRKDADRYRWLRDNWFTMASEYKGRVIFTTGRPRWSDLPESSVDAAIDAAMGKGGEA